LYISLACKRVCGGGYLLYGKRQAYHVRKTINLPSTYLLTKPFDPALLLDISFFCRLTMNQNSDRQTRNMVMKLLHEPVMVMFLVAPKDERMVTNFLPELSLELGRELNFDKMVMLG
jgi:hypothetical protein